MTVIEVLTALGTIGAAVVAAVSVVITGHQGREQQRLLVLAQEHDVAERRADFELGLLMDLSRVSRAAWGWNRISNQDDQDSAKALLIALPPDLLPVLRALIAPSDDTLAGEVLKPFEGNRYPQLVQRAVDRELRDAIFDRRDLPATRVSERLAGRSSSITWSFGR